MAEYIEREAFKEVLTRYLNAPHVQTGNLVGQGMRIAIKSCIEFLDNEYAADIAPVRHGRWIPISDGDGAECSKCGEYFDVSDGAGMAAFKMLCVAYKFCPNCGTLMDLEGE